MTDEERAAVHGEMRRVDVALRDGLMRYREAMSDEDKRALLHERWGLLSRKMELLRRHGREARP